MAVVWKLLTLIAVLLMPFGMVAPASATPHHAMASMSMEHCPDQSPGQKGKLGFTECTMACAGALPAADRSPQDERRVDVGLALALPVHQLHGIHVDIATPPPKRS